MAQLVKNPRAMQETWVQSLDREDPLEKGIGYPLEYSWASLVAQLIKNPPAMGGPEFHPWVGKIPWRRERLPTPLFWPGEFHGFKMLFKNKFPRLNQIEVKSVTLKYKYISVLGVCVCVCVHTRVCVCERKESPLFAKLLKKVSLVQHEESNFPGSFPKRDQSYEMGLYFLEPTEISQGQGHSSKATLPQSSPHLSSSSFFASSPERLPDS